MTPMPAPVSTDPSDMAAARAVIAAARLRAVMETAFLGDTDGMRQRLTDCGLFAEIISWTLRLFVPTDAKGVTVLTRLFAHWPIRGISDREAG